MTLSGEVLSQAEFSTRKLLQLCYDSNIHTAIETSGYGEWEKLKEMAKYTDLFLYDIKHMNPITHGALTGVSNVPILQNLESLIEMGKQIIIRVPFTGIQRDRRKPDGDGTVYERTWTAGDTSDAVSSVG